MPEWLQISIFGQIDIGNGVSTLFNDSGYSTVGAKNLQN